MKLGIVVNDVDTEFPTAATTVMAHAATLREHDVFMIGVGDLTYYSGNRIAMVARRPPSKPPKDPAEFLKSVQGPEAKREKIFSEELDVLYLRYNPVEDPAGKMWEKDAGIVFGQIAIGQGVIVLNHPYTLSFAVNKMYLEHFPEEIRPTTIITRSYDEIRAFYEEQGRSIVVKPVHGYGGKDVFLLKGDATNLKQIVENIGRSSYVIAQEYLPAGAEGDTRLFLVNGRPLVSDGKYAAVRRRNPQDDFRSNMTAGGKPQKAEITPGMLRIAELLRPKLLSDGLFFVGLDIVGDKLVEINTISAGGLNAAGKLEKVNFGIEVVKAIERKVEYRRHYGFRISNRELAVFD